MNKDKKSTYLHIILFRNMVSHDCRKDRGFLQCKIYTVINDNREKDKHHLLVDRKGRGIEDSYEKEEDGYRNT